MKNLIFSFFLVLYAIYSNAQSISIDSLYWAYNDTIMYNKTNRYYLAKIWMSYNGGEKRLLSKTIMDREELNDDYYRRHRFSPEILKFVFNSNDSIVYFLHYSYAVLKIHKVKLDGSYVDKTPWDIVPTTEELAERTQFSNLRLKDIDMKIEDDVLILKCYQYLPQFVVFKYNFSNKGWTISEDIKLSSDEITECGLYE